MDMYTYLYWTLKLYLIPLLTNFSNASFKDTYTGKIFSLDSFVVVFSIVINGAKCKGAPVLSSVQRALSWIPLNIYQFGKGKGRANLVCDKNGELMQGFQKFKPLLEHKQHLKSFHWFNAFKT